jgi:hypothetical protein
MEQMTFSTPAILFSTVSLLFIAFTNRYISITVLVRQLHTIFARDKASNVIPQIVNLQMRLRLIKIMQSFSIASLLFSSSSMFFIFFNYQNTAKILFGFGIVIQFAALCICAMEISLSTKALDIELSDIELNDYTSNPIPSIVKKVEVVLD